MKQYGVVMSALGDRVTVAVRRTAACDSCGRCKHSHIVFGDTAHLVVEALALGHVKPGDTVELTMASGDFVRASFLLWMFPLAGSAAGYLLGWILGNFLGAAQPWAIAFALASLGLSFLYLHHYDKSAGSSGRFLPLARAIDSGPPPAE